MTREALSRAVERDPGVHSGDLVFRGTRVTVDALTDVLRHGGTLDEFLDAYPSVKRWQAESVLESSSEAIEALIHSERGHRSKVPRELIAGAGYIPGRISGWFLGRKE